MRRAPNDGSNAHRLRAGREGQRHNGDEYSGNGQSARGGTIPDRTVGRTVDRAAHETNVMVRRQVRASQILGKRADRRTGMPAKAPA